MVLDFYIFLLQHLHEFFIINSQFLSQFMYPHFRHINYLLYVFKTRSDY